jgi:glycosyltransferase involved in cell wall biosynthesis
VAPLISVCLPVYNGERFLSSAIESVLAQTEPDFELIISDDASTDGSADIIRKYASQDRRIVVSNNEANFGLFANYNQCLERSSGRYIKPFAQDDLLATTALARLKAVLDKHTTVSLVSSRRTLIDEQGRISAGNSDTPSFDDYFPCAKPVLGRAVIRESLLPLTNFIGEPATVMFRANSAKSFDTTLYHLGDLDLWLRLLIEGDAYFISDALCKFRTHESCRSKFNNETLLFWLDYIRIGRNFTPILKTLGSNERDFLGKNMRALAHHSEFIEESGGGTLTALRQQREIMSKMYLPKSGASELELERMLADLLDFRELAFLAIATMSDGAQHAEESSAVTGDRCGIGGKSTERGRRTQQYYLLLKRNQTLITKLESRLSRLLSTHSWRLTKPLRDLNRLLGFGAADVKVANMQKFEREVKVADDTGGLDFQRLYIGYLRQQIACVRRSKSWRYTRVLRKLKTV